MSDWSDFGDIGSDFGVPQDPGITDWNSGMDLPGGGDTGQPTGPGSSFNVGPGQIPSSIYQALISSGLLKPGANVPTLTGYGGTGTPGGGGGGASSLARMLGLSGADGGMNLPALLSMLAPLLGAGLSYKATQKATDQMSSAVKDANAQATSILGGATGMYAPYMQAGQAALGKAQGLGFQPLAGKFGPLHGPGATATLGKIMR